MYVSTLTRRKRRGSVLPLLVVSLVGLLGLVAMAVDLGMLAVARTQCQAVADSTALSGARALSGDPTNDYNKSAVSGYITQATNLGTIMGQPVATSQVTTTIGSYRYDDKANTFVVDPTSRNTGDAWSLVQATVTATNNTTFGRVFGINSLPATAVATAAHRPRDVAVVIDFSGSMRLNSLLGGPVTDSTGLSLANRDRAMNPETVYPTWGHYSTVSTWRGSNAAVAFTTASNDSVGPSNLVIDNDNGPAVIKDFYQDSAAFGSTTPAFTPQSSAYATSPGGDDPLTVKGSSTWASNVNEVIGRTSTDTSITAYTSSPFKDNQSYSVSDAGYGNGFVGYSQGPNYWGKTFWSWPPDPRGPQSAGDIGSNNKARDWRQRFFIQIYLGTSTSISTSGGSGGGGSGGGGSGGGGTPVPPPALPPPLNVDPRADKPLYYWRYHPCRWCDGAAEQQQHHVHGRLRPDDADAERRQRRLPCAGYHRVVPVRRIRRRSIIQPPR